jgi:hypothetical protein
MSTNMKVLMQKGTCTEHVLTVNVPGNRWEHILSLAQMAITGAMQSRNINVDGHLRNLNKVSNVLKKCDLIRKSSRLRENENRSSEVQAHSSLLVSGTVMFPESDSLVVYGPASFFIENTKLQTNIPDVHIASTSSDNYKITCMLQSHMMIVLLLFLQKQNLALTVYLFGLVLSLPD